MSTEQVAVGIFWEQRLKHHHALCVLSLMNSVLLCRTRTALQRALLTRATCCAGDILTLMESEREARRLR